MPDVTVASYDEMEPIYDGIARRARATLGVTAWGMQLVTLPPNWDGYPDHVHDAAVEDANQEEVYIPVEGSADLWAGEEHFALRPGVMARVGPAQRRRIVPGDDGIRLNRARRRAGDVPSLAVDRARRPLARPAVGSPRMLSSARRGDEEAFVRLTGPHRRALHLHCYRVLGSLCDADDAM